MHLERDVELAGASLQLGRQSGFGQQDRVHQHRHRPLLGHKHGTILHALIETALQIVGSGPAGFDLADDETVGIMEDNVDPVAAQLLDPKTLKPGVADLTAEMVKRYKAETGAQEVPPHTSMGFNNAYIFLSDVLPRAIKKHGGYDPEALRKAAGK